MRRDVTFSAEDGTMLRGWLHPAPQGIGPAIVMTHGFSGVKEQIDHYAAAFARAGFSVLVYDHRGFGASDGEPRQEIDPARQLSDWRDALTFIERMPEIDAAAGVGIWGSSFAGGLAIILAANDRRVTCVVAQIPNVSGHRNARELFSPTQRTELAARFQADRVGRIAGAPPAVIPVFGSSPRELVALPTAVTPGFIGAIETAAPGWRNEVTLRSLEHVLEYEPAGWLPYVSPTPLLMIVAANDTITFPHHQLEAFESALGPKQLVIHPGDHFDTYADHFEHTRGAASRWFAQHLSPRTSRSS
jgi:fermentation-respiration switch protein FrsA (DUF1100 family)